MPTRRRKKPLTGVGAQIGLMRPIRPNAVWALDFQFDITAHGATLKLLNVVDEFTRECFGVMTCTGPTVMWRIPANVETYGRLRG